MLHAIILICALTTQPYACGEDTARDVLRTPVETRSPFACFFEGQAYAAAMDYPLKDDEYRKVACVREHLPKDVG